MASLQDSASVFNVQLEEIRALCRTSINFLGALVLGQLFRCDFPDTHLSFFDILTSDITTVNQEKISQIAFGLPRGFCKTTLLKLYVLWVLCYTDIRYILIVSKSSELAQNFVADVCDFLDNQNISSIFSNWRSSISRDTLDLKCFSFNGTPRVLQAIGAQTSVRGTNINNERPELIVCEDIQDKECTDSTVLNEKFIAWFLGTLLKVRSSYRSQVVFLGNMYNETCLLNRLRLSPEWFSFIAPAVLLNRQSIWPEFRSYESLMREFRNDISLGHPEVFLAEVMNDPIAQAAISIDINKMKNYPFLVDQVPDGAFITIDPATGTKDGNLTSIILHHAIDGKACPRKIRNGSWGDEETVKQGLIFALEEGVSLIAVEDVAYQVALANLFLRTISSLQIQGIKVVPVSPKGRPKNSRIRDFLKRVEDGDSPIHPEAQTEILFQAARFKPLKKNNEDDTLDAAAYGDEVLREHFHEITYNARTFDATYNKAEVWAVEDCSPF